MRLTHKLKLACCLAVLATVSATFAIPLVKASESNASWTVLVYLDGDNNLDPDSVNDIAEMMTVGSTDKVNVIALWDRYSEPAYLYQVLPGELVQLDGLTVNGLDVNGQEISMTDWHVLEAFVDYGKANFPADHYMLDLWDHGNAFGYACWDDHWEAPWTPSPKGALSLADVVNAIGETNMDILTYDGCTIGMVEIAYQLSYIQQTLAVNIQYLVASEEYIPNNGYDYGALLSNMNEMQDTSAGAVAKMMTDTYAATYSPHGSAKGSSTVGLSAVDLSKIGPIASKMKALTDLLIPELYGDYGELHDLLSRARGEANLGWSLNGWDDRVDLGTFLAELSKLSKDPTVSSLADEALAVITDAVYVANTPALDSQSAHGLGIWFPSSVRSIYRASYVIGQYSESFAFSGDAGWLSFLYAYWGKLPKK